MLELFLLFLLLGLVLLDLFCELLIEVLEVAFVLVLVVVQFCLDFLHFLLQGPVFVIEPHLLRQHLLDDLPAVIGIAIDQRYHLLDFLLID